MISKRSFQIVIMSIGLLMAGFVIQPAAGEDGSSESVISIPAEKSEVGSGVEPEATSVSKPKAASEAIFEVKVKVGIEETPAAESELTPEKELAPGHITMSFKDADIRNVLRSIADKGGINIIAGPEVEGAVTVQLVDVPWEKALKVILNTYDFGCERDGNIIIVTTLKKLTARRKEQQELAGVEPVVTRVFKLKYVDAGDVAAFLKDQVSERGVIAVLEEMGQKGWAFGTGEFKKRERIVGAEGTMVKSKTLVVSDIPSYLERIEEIIAEIDVMPKQILIETKLVEVNNDKLRDLGIEIGSGTTGWAPLGVQEGGGTVVVKTDPLAVTPANFNPLGSGFESVWSNADGFKGGLTFMYQKLLGSQMRVILHALEEDVETNILSAPQITTLNNQEATIMVGMKYPILKGEVDGGVLTTSLDYYQDIGIQLSVIPQICGENQINMIVHPSVTSYTTTVDAKSMDAAGDIKKVLAQYPIILTREAETQVLINDGDAIVIGGLMKDVKTESVIGIPFLKDIPILGLLFKRTTVDVEKIDLLIFISAHIVGPDNYLFSGGNVLQAPPTKDANLR